MKVREGGRVVNTHVLVASDVNADGTVRSSASTFRAEGIIQLTVNVPCMFEW